MAIDFKPQLQVLRVGNFIGGHQPGTDGAEGVSALAFDPLAGAFELESALGNVIDRTVASDVCNRVGLANIFSRRSNDHA
jgi:hypothetical protein